MGTVPTRPSDYELPDDFSAALDGAPGLHDAFLSMPPSHRREYLRYVGEAKRPETRTRRIERSLIRIREYADEHSPPPGPP
jgi:uncharacterized protein YdeI (YjbR/CyaY-like superfamily)